jgi:hypothetical protein
MKVERYLLNMCNSEFDLNIPLSKIFFEKGFKRGQNQAVLTV